MNKKPGNSYFKKKRVEKKSKNQRPEAQPRLINTENGIRLNKFIAHSGVCSRRDADTMIADGRVKVNGTTITEMGFRVNDTDTVLWDGKPITRDGFIYIIMHKPSNTITTTDDEKNRKTVMDVIEEEIGKRVYPVGRLDRDTTGLLLLTNDGDLTNRLMHPSYNITKVYEATCNRNLTDYDLKQLINGVQLEDGPAKALELFHFKDQKHLIEITIHEGRNHIIKRMIEAIGAEVIRLKRVAFAGMVLKNLRAGRWRYLRPEEINRLRSMVRLPNLKFPN